jgi:hypothetical protein
VLCSVSVERDNDEDPIWRIPLKAGLARLQQDGEVGNSPILREHVEKRSSFPAALKRIRNGSGKGKTSRSGEADLVVGEKPGQGPGLQR